MHSGDLELCATEDLIDELIRRSTFQGVVVHAEGGVRDREWKGERVFKVRFNANLDHDEVQRLLGVVGEHMLLFGS
jgi:hypothetical protein